jgi:tetratricopeptide (TPR) repeat protein
LGVSLINKMLQDLESRDRAVTPGKVTLGDLRPVRRRERRASWSRLLLVLPLLVVGIAAGAYYFLELPGTKSAPAKLAAPVAAPVPVVREEAPAVAKTPVPEPAPTVAAAPPPVRTEAPQPAPQRVAKAVRKLPPPAPAPAAEHDSPPPTADTAAPGTEKAVIEKHDRPVTPLERAEALYRQAAQQIGQGRNEQARATLAAALASSPEHHKARELAAAVAMQSGHLREAQELLTQGMQLAPQQSIFPRLLARTLLEQGLDAQAVATLERARNAVGADADYLTLLAALYQRAGRHTEAASSYRETIALRTQDARAWLGLGISLEATQDASAADAYTRALQLGGLEANLMQYASQRLAALKRQ